MTTEKYKQFNKGLTQLREEGVVQVLYAVDQTRREPILGAVGQLQFEVVVSRLAAEYNVETMIEALPYNIPAWIEGDEAAIEAVRWPLESLRTLDHDKRWVVLFNTPYQLRYTIKDHPELKFLDVAGNSLNEADRAL